MARSKMFQTAYEAQDYFGCDEQVEECECCGLFTVSRAVHPEGGIVGPWMDGDETVFDRICEECDVLSPMEVLNKMGIKIKD